jgi:hypothetical protein
MEALSVDTTSTEADSRKRDNASPGGMAFEFARIGVSSVKLQRWNLSKTGHETIITSNSPQIVASISKW